MSPGDPKGTSLGGRGPRLSIQLKQYGFVIKDCGLFLFSATGFTALGAHLDPCPRMSYGSSKGDLRCYLHRADTLVSEPGAIQSQGTIFHSAVQTIPRDTPSKW